MGRGKSKAGAQKPTRAVAIENMNEAQIDIEIRKTQRTIQSAERTMGQNDFTSNENERAMREAFPLGAGGDGWSEARIRQNTREIERNVRQAKNYTEAAEKKASAETRLSNLQNAKRQISGTGKTQAELRAEATKRLESTKSTLKWKTTQKGGWTKDGGYMPKTIKAGNYEIRGSGGVFSIYKSGQRIGTTSKLATAKAFVERDNRS